MLVHVLGWFTVALTLVVTGGTCHFLFNAGREQRTWLRKPSVPRFTAVPLVLSSGSDYVGAI